MAALAATAEEMAALATTAEEMAALAATAEEMAALATPAEETAQHWMLETVDSERHSHRLVGSAPLRGRRWLLTGT